MLDVAPTELLVVAVVALLVIGPKDLPKAMHVVGKWVGKMRAVARQFRSGFDNMVREAELAEMEKKWAAENERIMREHPPVITQDPAPVPALPEPAAASPSDPDGDSGPVMVPRPELRDDPPQAASPASAPTKQDDAA